MIRPGWFFSVICFLYYGFPILTISFYKDYYEKRFSRVFTENFLDDVAIVLLICQIAFFVAEFFCSKMMIRKVNYKIEPINSKVIYLIIGISILLFFKRWNTVGGFFYVLGANRTEVINEAASSGVFSRYDVFLNIVTVYLSINFALAKGYLSQNKLLVTIYSGFLLLIIAMGTRLLFLNYLIGSLCVVYFLNNEIIIKNRKKVSVYIIIIITSLILFQTIRNDIQNYFANNNFSINKEELTIIPLEFYTGILSEHSLSRGMINDYDFTYFIRLVPESIKSILGLQSYDTYAVDIANYSSYSSGSVVYTIPFVMDVYHGVGNDLILTFVTVFVIYFLFNIYFSILSRQKYHIIYVLLLYFLLYNVLRVEGPIWFSKIYLSVIFMFIFEKMRRVTIFNS